MHDDYELAAAISTGSQRGIREFRKRFRQSLAIAFEHCAKVRDLGLSLEDYAVGIAKRAAHALLASLPSRREDASLEPFVRRLCGRRDVALAIMLARGNRAAWSYFESRFGRYLRSLFIRCGYAAVDAEALLKEFMTELDAVGGDGRRPIAAYEGRTDLQDWLFVYVLRRFRGGLRPGRQNGLGEDSTFPGVEYESQAGEQASERRRFVECEFDAQWQKLSSDDRRLLALVALGTSPSATAAACDITGGKHRPSEASVVTRHLELVKSIWIHLQEVLASRFRMSEQEADRFLREWGLDVLSREIEEICNADGR